jgi:hypothetical protein
VFLETVQKGLASSREASGEMRSDHTDRGVRSRRGAPIAPTGTRVTGATHTRAVVLPLRTRSTLNQREHWATRHRRTRDERALTLAMLRIQLGPLQRAPVGVRLVRIAPRALDDDNLRGALKAIRDGVQDYVGVDDRYLRVDYDQVRGRPGEYGVRVELFEL